MIFESGALLLVGAMGGQVLEGLLVFLDWVWIGVCSLGDGGLALLLIVAVWALLIVCFAGTVIAIVFVS